MPSRSEPSQPPLSAVCSPRRVESLESTTEDSIVRYIDDAMAAIAEEVYQPACLV
jgi:hypothetical protein